jgi:hypothetical protein
MQRIDGCGVEMPVLTEAGVFLVRREQKRETQSSSHCWKPLTWMWRTQGMPTWEGSVAGSWVSYVDIYEWAAFGECERHIPAEFKP